VGWATEQRLPWRFFANFWHDTCSGHLVSSQYPTDARNIVGLGWPTTFGKENTLYIEVANRRPNEVLEMDMETGEVKDIVFSGGPIPLEHPWTSVTFPSSDGQPIQAWLITPEGEGPFPTILAVHGGPRACEWERYAPEFQLWVDHGCAVFAVNYRGYTGFGRTFEEKIIGNPGYWELEDIVAGHNFFGHTLAPFLWKSILQVP